MPVQLTDPIPPFNCALCSRTFKRQVHLARHLLSHSNAKHRCHTCGMYFHRADVLARHTSTHDLDNLVRRRRRRRGPIPPNLPAAPGTMVQTPDLESGSDWLDEAADSLLEGTAINSHIVPQNAYVPCIPGIQKEDFPSSPWTGDLSLYNWTFEDTTFDFLLPEPSPCSLDQPSSDPSPQLELCSITGIEVKHEPGHPRWVYKLTILWSPGARSPAETDLLSTFHTILPPLHADST